MEPKEIDVVARDLPLDHQRRVGNRLGRLERAVVFLLGDLRQLADREQERIGDPVIGLDPHRIDPDRELASTFSLSFQLDASPLGAGESSLKPNGAISRGLPARLVPLKVSSLA